MHRTDRNDGMMTPEQRRAEVAEILALAVVRLRLRAALPTERPGAEKPSETVVNPLRGSFRNEA